RHWWRNRRSAPRCSTSSPIRPTSRSPRARCDHENRGLPTGAIRVGPGEVMDAGRVVDVVVVGAGHNGLAMSRALSQGSLDHVVLERGEVGNAWRAERWDGLRLLTPNWLCRLPGWHYRGVDPDGYM